MTPYVARVLAHPANWMVYSTALLERSWLDFGSQYGRERAVLQLQALVDQHHPSSSSSSSSSSYFNSNSSSSSSTTTSSTTDDAPVHVRLRYLHTLFYPAQWELKRDLAERYASLGVVASAADLFLKLEM